MHNIGDLVDVRAPKTRLKKTRGKVVRVFLPDQEVSDKEIEMFWGVIDGPFYKGLISNRRKTVLVVVKPDDREGYVISPEKYVSKV